MSFSVKAQVYAYIQHGWQKVFEVFAQCNNCSRPSIFLLSQKKYDDHPLFKDEDAILTFTKTLNNVLDVEGFISLKDNIAIKIPEHLPPELESAFREGASCFAVRCYNAAGTMFRLCVDLATRSLLPKEDDASGVQPNSKQRRDLGLRLPWLFDQGILPLPLRELAKCIHQDGNDGAHAGTLTKEDAADIQDFTNILLERLISEPKVLGIAEARRIARRAGSNKPS